MNEKSKSALPVYFIMLEGSEREKSLIRMGFGQVLSLLMCVCVCVEKRAGSIEVVNLSF